MMYVFKHEEIKTCSNCPMETGDDYWGYKCGLNNKDCCIDGRPLHCPLMKTGIASKIKR